MFSLRTFLDFGSCFRPLPFKFRQSLLFMFRFELFFDLGLEMPLFLSFQARFGFRHALQGLLLGDAQTFNLGGNLLFFISQFCQTPLGLLTRVFTLARFIFKLSNYLPLFGRLLI